METLNVEKLGIPVGRSLEPVRHVPIRIVGKRLRGYDASRFIAHIVMYGKGERGTKMRESIAPNLVKLLRKGRRRTNSYRDNHAGADSA